MRRDDLNVFDIDRFKRSLKSDTKRWMNSLMMNRWAYVSQYKERVDEYLKFQKEYWRIYYINPTNGHLQKSILDSLQNVTAALTNLYDIMPEIAGASFTNVKEPTTLPTTPEDTTTENSQQPVTLKVE